VRADGSADPGGAQVRGACTPAKLAGKWGYIDKTGNIVIEPQFDSAHRFSAELAQVHVGDKIGYIDKTGRYVWQSAK
jgi:hypothetical protein